MIRCIILCRQEWPGGIAVLIVVLHVYTCCKPEVAEIVLGIVLMLNVSFGGST